MFAYGPFGVTVDSAKPNGAAINLTSPQHGNNSWLIADRLIVGADGWGALTTSGAGPNQIGNFESRVMQLKVAQNPGSVGTVTLNGESKADLQSLEAGLGGDAYINVNGSSKIIVDSNVALGALAETGSATLNINGGELSAANITALNGTTTTVTTSGKILLKQGGDFSMGGSLAHPATLNVQSSSQLTGEGDAAGTQLLAGVSGKAVVNVNSGGQVAVQQIAVGRHTGNASTFTVTGGSSFTNSDVLIVHPGAMLTAAAGGLVQVQDTAVINGTVDVLDGKMTIGAVGSPGTLGTVTVAGGTLLGRGTIKGNLIAKKGVFPDGQVLGVRIKPGASPCALTVDGGGSLEPDSVLEMEIGGLAAGTEVRPASSPRARSHSTAFSTWLSSTLAAVSNCQKSASSLRF